MKVLLLGGFGYIGSTLTEYLLTNSEDKITVLDTMEFGVDPLYFYNVLNHERVQFIKADKSNVRVVYDLIKKHDVIVDLAALSLPNSAREPGDAILVNQIASEVIADFCRKLGKRLVFMSTCSNYGKSKTLVAEDGELLPVSIYAISKVNAEKYILNNTNNSIVLRCATAYGVGSGRTRWDVLYNDFVKTALDTNFIDVFQPDAHRPICHVADIAQAISLASLHPIEGPTVFNIGSSEQNYTKRQLAKIVGDLSGAEIKFVEKEDKRDYKVNFNKAEKILGFSALETPETAYDDLKELYDRSVLY